MQNAKVPPQYFCIFTCYYSVLQFKLFTFHLASKTHGATNP